MGLRSLLPRPSKKMSSPAYSKLILGFGIAYCPCYSPVDQIGPVIPLLFTCFLKCFRKPRSPGSAATQTCHVRVIESMITY